GNPQELVSAIKRGYLYQGQRYFWQSKGRGSSTCHLQFENFVHFIQNHDQVANSARGDRLHLLTTPGRYKAATALLLLGPQTPMIFQGQEFASSSPFLYFADLSLDIARLVRRGRIEFLMQFSNLASPEIIDLLDNPSEESTFIRSKLDVRERETNFQIYSLYRDLLAIRKEDTVFSGRTRCFLDGAVLGQDAFVIRFFGSDGDRLLIVNMGRDLRLRPVPEPLLGPPQGGEWEVQWSSEHPRYGGNGTPDLETDNFWRIPGHAAVVLRPAGSVPPGGNT
ncbi:MAG TPA: DUF3459 domain-containing protein, partial [Verrucomicrobiae bacterium]|nr:DUF3459 domain-containing protein [Verrucomicrobiae bacterium]